MEYRWLLKFVLGVVGWIALYFACRQAVSLYGRKQKRALDWAKIVLLPLKVFFLLGGVCYGAGFVGMHFEFHDWPQKAMRSVFSGLTIATAAWMALRWKRELLHSSPSHGLGKLIAAFIVILATLLILSAFHMDIVPLLAFGGIGAAALGFAAKDIISNFLGGVMLHMTQPFFVGDDILLPDRKIEGKVEDIGWYQTAIRDKDRRPVYLPNSFFAELSVINASRMTHRRIYETLSIRYEDFSKLALITDKIRQFLYEYERIDSSVPVLVFFHHAGAYSIDIYLDVYTKDTSLEKYLAVKETVLKQIFSLIQEAGAEMPYPITTVELRGGSDFHELDKSHGAGKYE